MTLTLEINEDAVKLSQHDHLKQKLLSRQTDTHTQTHTVTHTHTHTDTYIKSVNNIDVFGDRLYPPTAYTGRFLQYLFSAGANRHKLITSFTQTKVVTTSFKAMRP